MKKDSFVLYTEYIEQIELLSMEQRGILLTAIFAYVSDAELPDMDGITKMAFAFIKSRIDKDTEKYAKTIEKRKEAGKLGGRPKANGSSEKQEKAKKANGFSEKQNNPVYDNVNVNVIPFVNISIFPYPFNLHPKLLCSKVSVYKHLHIF